MFLIVHFYADRCMRADQCALAALDTNLFVPHRNFESDVPFLPCCGAGRECSVDRHGAHREIVAKPGNNFREDVFHKVGRLLGYNRRQLERAVNFCRHLHFEKIRQRLVDSVEIHLYDIFPLSFRTSF